MRYFRGKKRCCLKCFPTFIACFARKNFQKRCGLSFESIEAVFYGVLPVNMPIPFPVQPKRQMLLAFAGYFAQHPVKFLLHHECFHIVSRQIGRAHFQF